MKAVILAAGKGTRMGNLTKDMPKPLLRVGSTTLLGNILDILPTEVDEIIIVIGYLGNAIKKEFGDYYNNKRIYYVTQEALDGTAGAVFATQQYFTQKNERFFIIYGDEYPTKEQVQECFLHEFSWLCREMSDPSQSGVATISPDGHIVEVVEKPENPKSNFVVAGMMVVNAEIFDYKPVQHENGEYYLTSMMDSFIKDRKVRMVKGTKDVAFSYAEDIHNFNINKSISVFLPAYNEEKSIGKGILEISNYLKSRFEDYEILIISEGSTDKTNKIVRDLQKEIHNLRLLAKDKSYGYAGALRTGFKSATKELIFYTDGDRQFDIKEMDKLLSLIDEYDIVTGYKIKRNDPLMRIWMSDLYNLTMRLVFGLKLKDVNCAFKLYHKYVIDNVDFLPDLTQGVINAEIYLTAYKKGYTIGEVGVHHFHRTEGFASSEFGRRGKIIAFVRPKTIMGFLMDTFKLWKKARKGVF